MHRLAKQKDQIIYFQMRANAECRSLIQLLRERLSEKMCTRQSRKVIWDMINTLFLTLYSCRIYHCCFPLAVANICPWPLAPFFQICLKNSEFKTTHNTFRDCRVHFFRQPFSKYLCIKIKSSGLKIQSCHTPLA